MHSVPFKLKDNAQEFVAGEYIGFGIRSGIKYQDNKKQDQWTNYKAAVFAKSQAQIDFYRANLIAGALVVVTAEKLAVETFTNNQGELSTAIKLINANVVAVKTDRAPDAAQQAHARGVNQSNQQQIPQAQSNKPAAAQAPQGFDSFDDDIPF